MRTIRSGAGVPRRSLKAVPLSPESVARVASLLLAAACCASCAGPQARVSTKAVPERVLSGAAAGVRVTTQHNDNLRSGANLQESALTPDRIRSGQFGKLFSRAVD